MRQPAPAWSGFSIRRLVLSGLLAVPLIVGTMAVTLPRFRVDKPGAVAILCLLLALALGGRALWRRPAGQSRALIWGLAGAALLALPFAVIARGFGRVDMLSMLFHVEFGMQGAGLGGLDSEILKVSVALILVVLALVLLSNLWQVRRGLLGLAILGLLVGNPIVSAAAQRLVFPPPEADLVAEFRLLDRLVSPTPLPDIALIYLEGTDRRFSDAQAYPGAYDPLRMLEPDALTFVNVGQIIGTGWSLAGMVASQCGVPLLPRGLIGLNNFGVVERFLPRLTCLTDVLGERGYAMDYIVGADEGFAGIDTFYRTHGVAEPLGLAGFRRLHAPDVIEAALVGWVLDDQLTFDTARLRLAGLLHAPAPFLQIVETIGPHGVNGYLSRRCTRSGRAEQSTDIVATARCTLEDTLAYITDLRRAHVEAARGRPLRIIVLSDHLNHSPFPLAVRPELALANTVMLIGETGSGRVIDTTGSMIDVYPTILEWLGFTAPGTSAGLGRSLLTASEPSLVARWGVATLDAMISGDAALSAFLWAETTE